MAKPPTIRRDGQFVDESASDRERSQPRQAIAQPATNRCSTTDKRTVSFVRLDFVATVDQLSPNSFCRSVKPHSSMGLCNPTQRTGMDPQAKSRNAREPPSMSKGSMRD